MDNRRTRRQVLTAAGASAALAGCVDTITGGEDGDGRDVSGAAWLDIPLEDVTAGEEFTIAEVDEPIVIHTFATWCITCQGQQEELVTVHAERDDLRLVDLTIDENDDPEAVAGHAEQHGFEWSFGVAPSELTRELVDEFGQEVSVAPQSPIIVICPDGTASSSPKTLSPEEITGLVDDTCG